MNQLSSQDITGTKRILTKRARKTAWFIGIVLFLITFFVYTPTLHNDFVNWEDSLYIVENTHIHTLNFQNLCWMFTTLHAGFWFPLTWVSHALDCSLWGLNPGMHHLTSIILHGLNVVLVFFLAVKLILMAKVKHSSFLSKIDKRVLSQSLIAGGVTALLFGLHPLRVESVAWVSERKDLLCAFFVLLALLSYLSYVSSIHAKHRRFWFATCLLLFVLALMSKPMAVTFPVVILLFDVYPLGRLNRTSKTFLSILLEKIPFFVLSLIFSVLTVITQKTGGALRNLEEIYFAARLVNALKAVVFYIIKMIWPVRLVPLYRLPNVIDPLDIQYLLSGFTVLAITGICVWIMIKGKPLWLAVWSYYLITLLPVAGIIQVGLHSAADRFTYLPSLSITLVCGLGGSWCWSRAAMSNYRTVARGVVLFFAFTVIALYSYLTVKQITIWKNSGTMWAAVIRTFPETVPDAYYGLGIFYYKQGRLDDAIAEFTHAISLSPDYAAIHHNLGNTYLRKGMISEAIMEFRKAIDLGFKSADTHTNLGGCYGRKGMLDEAISEFKRAIAINPDFEDAYVNLGLAYYKKKELSKAILEFKKAIYINPDAAWAHYNLARGYYDEKSYQRAVTHFEQAINLGYKVPARFLRFLEPYQKNED